MVEKLQLFLTQRSSFWLAGTTSFLLIAGAHAFERIGGLPPCPLCLDQREVHWVVLAIFVISLCGQFLWPNSRVRTLALVLMAAAFAFSAWLSGYHAGVEWGFWPGPPTCSGGGGLIDTTTDLLAGIESGPVISCTDAAWRMFGISMAGYNFLISGGLFLTLSWVLFNSWRSR